MGAGDAGICAEAARQSVGFDEAGFDRAISAYAQDIASPAGDFISLLDEADATEALLEEAALYGARIARRRTIPPTSPAAGLRAA